MLIDFRQLFPRWNIKPTGVLHIGANVGEEAPVYDELGIKNVIWIEGNPDLMQRLNANLSPYPGQAAFNYVIGDIDGKEVIFHVSNNASQSSSILELGTHKSQHPEVHYVKNQKATMRTISSLVNPSDLTIKGASFGVCDFLNIDLQGAELMALRGMYDYLKQFKWAYLEVNKAQVYEGCPHVNDLDLFMNGFGFKRVETHSWIGDWSDALYIKNGL